MLSFHFNLLVPFFSQIKDGRKAAQNRSVTVTLDLGGDHIEVHTADLIHCVCHNDYECFVKYLED